MSLAAHCMSCSWEEFGEHCQGSQAPPAQTCCELLAWRLLCPLRFVFVEESTVLGEFSKHCVTLEAAVCAAVVEMLFLWWLCVLLHKYSNCLGDFGECFCAQGCLGPALSAALWLPGSQPHLSAHARTALMLGCEYGCKDAVEVLLRNGADAALTDGLGHDCAYYARIGDNIDILALIKAALEDSSRGRRNLHPLPLGGIVSLCVQELFWRAAVLL